MRIEGNMSYILMIHYGMDNNVMEMKNHVLTLKCYFYNEHVYKI